MAIKKSQLYSALWESCNALRGSMDASQYKDYVLIVLFVKYLSDKAGQPGFRLKVPEGCSFKDFVALKQDDKIGEKMNTKLEAIKELNARQIGDLALPNFNDPTKLGSGRTMVDTLSKLIGVFENDALDFSHNRAADDDLLGDAYEYLMKNFAAESGKSKGQFYTPAEVSRVMAKLLRINELDRAEHTIYDPTCGSGSLLLRALAEASNPRVSIFGQEKDSSTAALAKLNMLLHGISSADIKVGDTLADPQFKQYGMVSTFDVCVANPPFSMKNWMASGMENDYYNRWTANLLPPAKCGDYAFLLHLIASMKTDEGRGACILPHGVLFRVNAEYDIRKHIVKQHYIKGIIGLPPNIFFGTSIPASIIIIDKKGKNSRKGIFFIDAKDGFKKGKAMNRLREQDIKRIVDAWDAQLPIDHYCRLVEWDEIERNDYNLNIPRYIQPKDTEIQHDIEAHLHGGLPAHDVDEMQEYWKACPSLKAVLFESNGNGYYTLKPEKTDIAHTIENEQSYINQSGQFAFLLGQWWQEVMPKMKSIGQGARPKELIADWSELLLDYVKGRSGLVDAYEVYDVLLNYWADVMQDDCYMIANDGWTYPKVRAVKSAKGKDKAIMYDELVCDLLPVNILLEEYFTKEIDEIAELSAHIEQKQAALDELLEAADDDEDEQNEIKKSLEYKIIDKEKSALNKTLKEKRTALTDAVVKKYAALTENEIKMLVVERKWLASVVNGCEALMADITSQITNDVTKLTERYETTLDATGNQVKDLEQEVLQSLNEMILSSALSHSIKNRFKDTEVGTIPEDWELVAISKLTRDMADGPFGSNLKTEHYTTDKQVRIIQLGNIGECGWLDENTKYTTFEHAKTLARCIATPGCILIAKMMPSGRAILCPSEEKQYILGSDVVRMTPNELLNAKYFVYQSKSDIYLTQIAANTQGSTRQRTSISKLRNILIPLPHDKSEQIRIATTLSDIDAFISELGKLKEKYTAIKQGMMQQLLTGRIRIVENDAKNSISTANVYFRRSVLAAEIADRLCDEPTFGHVKMEKILFLSERLCHIDIGSHYHRDAAGPYDNTALRSIDSQLKKQKWFEVQRTEKGNRYIPMQNRGKHKIYFNRYYSDILPTFDKIINTFKTERTEKCEIVATLYSAWEDLLHSNKPFTDADVVNEVLNNWHESKKRISQDRWLRAIQWMRENGFAPDNNNN